MQKASRAVAIKIQVGSESCEEDSKAALRASCQSSRYRRAMRNLKFYTKAVSLRIIEDPRANARSESATDSLEDGAEAETQKKRSISGTKMGDFEKQLPTCNVIDSQLNSIRSFRGKSPKSEAIKSESNNSDSNQSKSRTNLGDNLLWPVNVLITSIVTYLSIEIAIAQFKYDRLISQWSPRVLPLVHVNESSLATEKVIEEGAKCAPNANYIYVPIWEQKQKLESDETLRWLEWIGDQVVEQPGMATIILGLLAILTLLFPLMGLLHFRTNQLRVDSLGFVINPMAECRRVRRELKVIINDLIRFVQTNRKSTAASTVSLSFISLSSSWSSTTNKLTNDYARMLQSIHKLDLIRPANLQFKLHRRLTRHLSLNLPIVSACSMCTGFIMTLRVTANEVTRRVSERLQSIECAKRWPPDGVSIEAQFGMHLIPLESAEHKLAYQNYFETRCGNSNCADSLQWFTIINSKDIETLRLVLIEMALNKMNFGIYCFIAIATIGYVNACIWLPYYLLLYSQSCISKMTWIQQINEQIMYCIALMNQRVDSNTESDGSRATGTILTPNMSPNSSDQHLIESITIAYLNYELFRRRQRSFKKLVDFLLIQPAVLVAAILLICYTVGTSIQDSDKLLLVFVATYLFSFINVYMLVGALTTNRVEKLIRNILGLVVSSSKLSIQNSIPMRLWRNQLLSERDAARMYAPSIADLSITYDKLVTLNAYLVGLWLVLLKPGS